MFFFLFFRFRLSLLACATSRYYPLTYECNSGGEFVRFYLVGMLTILALVMCTLIVLINRSAQGAINDVNARRFVPHIIAFKWVASSGFRATSPSFRLTRRSMLPLHLRTFFFLKQKKHSDWALVNFVNFFFQSIFVTTRSSFKYNGNHLGIKQFDWVRRWKIHVSRHRRSHSLRLGTFRPFGVRLSIRLRSHWLDFVLR